MTSVPISFQTLLGNTKDTPNLLSQKVITANSNYPPFGFRPLLPSPYHSLSNLGPTLRLSPEHSVNDIVIPANWRVDPRITVAEK